MNNSNLECVSVGSLIGERQQQAALEIIAKVASRLDEALEQFGVSEGRRAYVGLKSVFDLGAFENRRLLAEALDSDLYVPFQGKPVPWRFETELREVFNPRAGSPFPPLANPFTNDFMLDMRANNARTAPTPGLPRHVRLSASSGRSVAQILMRNTVQGIRSIFRPLEASRAIILPGACVPDQNLERALRVALVDVLDNQAFLESLCRAVARQIAAVDANKIALEKMIGRFGKTLRFVAVDSPANPLEVALLETSNQHGILVIEESHGNIVVHGGGIREAVAARLAGGGYNWTPDAAMVVPRSPMQALGLPVGKRVIQANRTIAYVETEAGDQRPFRILFAPNFVRWNIAIPGLVPTCFDIHEVAHRLAQSVANNRAWEMAVRVKVTTRDTASDNDMALDRGLMPSDLAPLYRMSPNIRDASRDSWSSLLKSCDLVITEGMTAVMHEALEHRVPVLFMNRSASRIPALPSTRLHELTAEDRSATYASSCEEDFAELIAQIALRHHGKPLRDDELRGLCWLDGPAGRHYLEIVWSEISMSKG